ncbi:MAG TPA: acetyl-CoA carboxylase biotin carboxyl carrier protein [Lentisphaeria bacterium]|nr:acetyl-CoA carboxylase biotin carboxyl carrier protein [Lentisphaeria bacterium]
MDIKTINRLAEIMTQHDLTELSLEQDQVKVRLARNPTVQRRPAAAVELSADVGVAGSMASAGSTAEQPGATAAVVTSPLVGTFYAAPSPEAPPFVSAGSKVKAGDVLCIVEAMKVMNEIKAERAGMITKVLVKNGDPVEYEQALFEITE